MGHYELGVFRAFSNIYWLELCECDSRGVRTVLSRECATGISRMWEIVKSWALAVKSAGYDTLDIYCEC